MASWMLGKFFSVELLPQPKIGSDVIWREHKDKIGYE